MDLSHTPWPKELADRYRALGYWADVPLTDILTQQVAARPDAVALICLERKFTYRQLDVLSGQLAQALKQRGLQPGDTALVQLPNIAEFYIVFFALLKIGITAVNALYSHQRLELRAYAKQLKPKLLIGDSAHCLFSDARFFSELQSENHQLDTVVMCGQSDFAENLDAMLQEQCLSEEAHTYADQVAFFQLSGGSTGTPKLIPRTHNDYYYSVRRSAELCRLSAQTRFLCALPAAHNFPLSSPGALGVFYCGGTVVLAPGPEAPICFSLIEQHQITMTALVPAAVSIWLQAAEHRRSQLSSLRLLQVGGASFPHSIARRVRAELGCELQQVFGMAEGLVNYTRLDDGAEKVLGTQGKPMCEHDEVRVVDSQGQDVAPGSTGMLITRGPYTVRGYYRAPHHNRNAFDENGFYFTGDLVQLDDDGYIRVVGRVKDQINRGGEKIAAEEIEALLVQNEFVSQAALIAIPDEIMGEKSCACVVVHGDVRAVTLRKFLREKGIAEYKLPDRFRFLDKLPLTAVGKIDKRTLRLMVDSPI
ncbi:(2,3-dihydroxybenzoyl)adenylate synthase [Ketobacter sp.]|nr:MAG: (2,3-dihydroxybenzoyl)adenylate synthase [Ketobacter sp.]